MRLLLAILLAGCGDNVPELDAGADAGIDAPADAPPDIPMLPRCSALGCDGSQPVPMDCPFFDEPNLCFCVSPNGATFNGWCHTP